MECYFEMLHLLFDQGDGRFSTVRTLTYTEDCSVKDLVALELRSHVVDMISILDHSWNFLRRYFHQMDNKSVCSKLYFPDPLEFKDKADLDKEEKLQKSFDELCTGSMVTFGKGNMIRERIIDCLKSCFLEPNQNTMECLFHFRHNFIHKTFPDIEVQEKKYTTAFGCVKKQKVFYVKYDSKELVVLEFMSQTKKIVAQTVTSLLYSSLIIPSACELLSSYIYGLELEDDTKEHSLEAKLDSEIIKEAYTSDNKEDAALKILQKLTATYKRVCMPNPYTHLAFDTCKPQMKPVRLEILGTHQCALYEYVEKMKELDKKVEIEWEDNKITMTVTDIHVDVGNNKPFLIIKCPDPKFNYDGWWLVYRDNTTGELINILLHYKLIVFRPPAVHLTTKEYDNASNATEKLQLFIKGFRDNKDPHNWLCDFDEAKPMEITFKSRQNATSVPPTLDRPLHAILCCAETLFYETEIISLKESINNLKAHLPTKHYQNERDIWNKIFSDNQTLAKETLRIKSKVDSKLKKKKEKLIITCMSIQKKLYQLSPLHSLQQTQLQKELSSFTVTIKQSDEVYSGRSRIQCFITTIKRNLVARKDKFLEELSHCKIIDNSHIQAMKEKLPKLINELCKFTPEQPPDFQIKYNLPPPETTHATRMSEACCHCDLCKVETVKFISHVKTVETDLFYVKNMWTAKDEIELAIVLIMNEARHTCRSFDDLNKELLKHALLSGNAATEDAAQCICQIIEDRANELKDFAQLLQSAIKMKFYLEMYEAKPNYKLTRDKLEDIKQNIPFVSSTVESCQPITITYQCQSHNKLIRKLLYEGILVLS